MVRRLSYLAPAALIGLLAWLGKPSWWALAMLTGAALYVWDYLWGERRVLDAAYGLQCIAIGMLVLLAAIALAWYLGVSLTALEEAGKGMSRRGSFLFHLPSVGIGVALYGAVIWSRAWARDQESR